jgi:tripartite-type tricarboxylate transporter receptor subunit TctC
MISRRLVVRSLGAAGVLGLSKSRLLAQSDATLRMLVGLPAGTSTDATARLVADKLQRQTGRTIVVENKAGAGQRRAMGELQRTDPDGNTLLLATSGPFAIYPHIYTNLEYDPFNDFTAIAGVAVFDVCISTGPMTGARTLPELIAWIRAQHGKASYGSPGNGTLSHFVGIGFSRGLNEPMTHIPYKDSNVAVLDVAAGRLPMHITGMSTTIELHKAGLIHIVATSGNKRSPSLPDVPTLEESGIKVSGTATIGIFGPPRMPANLVQNISDSFLKSFHGDDIAPQLAIHGIIPEPSGTTEFQSALKEEFRRVGALAEASGFVKMVE